MVRLCASDAISEGQIHAVDVGKRSVVIARVDGRVLAVDNVCGHQSRRMDGGAVVRGKKGEPCLECPHHAMCFDLRDGAIVEDAGHLNMDPLRPLRVSEKDGAIWIELSD